MRVLLLSYAFPPMNVPEAILSAKALGNVPSVEVDVIAANPARRWMGDDHSLDNYVAERFASVRRVRSPLLREGVPLGRIGPLSRLPDVLRVLNGAALRAARDGGPYDAVVTWSQWHSVHLVGRRLRRSTGVPWAAHFSDPWSDNPYVSFDPVSAWMNRRMEDGVLRTADLLLFTSDETADLMTRRDSSLRSKALVQPHVFDPALYPASTRNRSDQRTILRHLGRFYGPRSPEPLLRALASLISEDPRWRDRIRVELIGEVAPDMLATSAARAVVGDVVHLVPPVDYATSLRLAVEADLLVSIDAPAATSVFLPSKLIDYVGARRPILCISPPGAAARLAMRLGQWVADPRDEGAVLRTLRSAVDVVSSQRPDIGSDHVRSTYRSDIVGAQLRTALEQLVRVRRDRI